MSASRPTHGAKPMTYAAQHKNFDLYVSDAAAPKRGAAVKKTGALRRIVDAIFESREKQADREIARILTGSGGRLTDDIERQMMQRLSPKNWSAPEE